MVEFITVQELEQRGIKYQTASEILFKNKTFVRGGSFSKRMSDRAIELCQGYLNERIHCFLVESVVGLTVWYEVKPHAAQTREDLKDKIFSGNEDRTEQISTDQGSYASIDGHQNGDRDGYANRQYSRGNPSQNEQDNGDLAAQSEPDPPQQPESQFRMVYRGIRYK